MPSRTMGAVALRGLRNLPSGVHTVERVKKAVAAAGSHSHVCRVGCDCRERHHAPWVTLVTMPQTRHRDNGVTYWRGGGTRYVPTEEGQRAFAIALALITPGRDRAKAAAFADSGRAERARYGIQTADPIVMPENVTTTRIAAGQTFSRRRDKVTGEWTGEPIPRTERPNPQTVAGENRAGDVRYESPDPWGRKWNRKSRPRPFSG